MQYLYHLHLVLCYIQNPTSAPKVVSHYELLNKATFLDYFVQVLLYYVEYEGRVLNLA
jgi:hypothetical protein